MSDTPCLDGAYGMGARRRSTRTTASIGCRPASPAIRQARRHHMARGQSDNAPEMEEGNVPDEVDKGDIPYEWLYLNSAIEVIPKSALVSPLPKSPLRTITRHSNIVPARR